MSRQQRITDILSQALEIEHLVVDNESYRHNVPPQSESHFKLLVVSDAFTPLTRIDRHRLVNQLLHQEFANGLHALSLYLYSPQEWQMRSGKVTASPDCKGGSRN